MWNSNPKSSGDGRLQCRYALRRHVMRAYAVGDHVLAGRDHVGASFAANVGSAGAGPDARVSADAILLTDAPAAERSRCQRGAGL